MEKILQTKELTKSFKKYKAIDGISMSINKGEIYGFVGKNGAGKTSFLKMVSGLSKPTSGEIFLFGENIKKKNKVLKRTSALIETPGLFDDLSAYENMKLKYMYIGNKNYNQINDILKLVELEDTGKKIVKEFSLGMKQRLGIALALIGEPEILFLDEPINGLDPQGIASIRNTILKLNKEKNTTIIISSHVLAELNKIATSYGFIDNGKLVASITNEELHEKCKRKIELHVDNTEKAENVIKKMNIKKYKKIDKNIMEINEKFDDTRGIVKNLVNADIFVDIIKFTEMSLEDFYFEMVGGKNEK